jgi:hypothetical protein
VLRDKNGDVRMVLNPNTGEFKMVAHDTVWYNLSTNSPTKQVEKTPNGGFLSIEKTPFADGSIQIVSTLQYGNNKGKVISTVMTVPPNNGSGVCNISLYLIYCPGGNLLEYSKITT